MAGEKYIVAADNLHQINYRNMLNPSGYQYVAHCVEASVLMRLIRTLHPDFIVVDIGLFSSDMSQLLETLDDEMLCACIIAGEYHDIRISQILEKSKVVSACARSTDKGIFLNTVELALINYRRLSDMNRKLIKATESLETRILLDRAKRFMTKSSGISEEEAYDRLRKKSMDERMSMKAIAEAVIVAFELQEGKEVKSKQKQNGR